MTAKSKLPSTSGSQLGIIRRRLLFAAGAFAFVRPAFAEVRGGSSYRIGHLSSGPVATDNAVLAPFREKLKSLGYDEGRNIAFEIRVANGNYELLPTLAAEIVATRPDIIFVATTPSLMAIFRQKASVPVVFAGIGPDPVGLGVIESIRHPGGDFTGITNNANEIIPKRLEMLRELLPDATRVVHFLNPLNPGATPAYTKGVEDAAAKVGFQMIWVDVKSAAEFPDAFAKAAELKADALFGSADPIAVQNRALIISLAAEHRLPAIYNFRYEATDGGLIAYGADLDAQYRSAAIYVDKVLKGEKTADLPVEQATKLALVVNLMTAKALGLSIPPLLMAQADQVIE